MSSSIIFLNVDTTGRSSLTTKVVVLSNCACVPSCENSIPPMIELVTRFKQTTSSRLKGLKIRILVRSAEARNLFQLSAYFSLFGNPLDALSGVSVCCLTFISIKTVLNSFPDEFDVFMDAVNRRISMKMMIDTANTSDKKQYILITPQDMTNVLLGPTVKVLRMQDPERGNGTLPFASQAPGA